MRRSAQVTLTVAAGVALTACARRPQDPCAAATFNEMACQDAVAHGGYYLDGSWFPMNYSHPYPYYYESYRTYRASGGTSYDAPGVRYGRPSGNVERGGFGSTGDAHAASSGHGSGAGE